MTERRFDFSLSSAFDGRKKLMEGTKCILNAANPDDLAAIYGPAIVFKRQVWW